MIGKCTLKTYDEDLLKEDLKAEDCPDIWESDELLQITVASEASERDGVSFREDEHDITVDINKLLNKHVFLAYRLIFQNLYVVPDMDDAGRPILRVDAEDWDQFTAELPLDGLVDQLLNTEDNEDAQAAWADAMEAGAKRIRAAIAEQS